MAELLLWVVYGRLSFSIFEKKLHRNCFSRRSKQSISLHNLRLESGSAKSFEKSELNVFNYLQEGSQLPISIAARPTSVSAQVGLKDLGDVHERQSLLEPSLLGWTVCVWDYLSKAESTPYVPLES